MVTSQNKIGLYFIYLLRRLSLFNICQQLLHSVSQLCCICWGQLCGKHPTGQCPAGWPWNWMLSKMKSPRFHSMNWGWSIEVPSKKGWSSQGVKLSQAWVFSSLLQIKLLIAHFWPSLCKYDCSGFNFIVLHVCMYIWTINSISRYFFRSVDPCGW